MSAPKDFLQAAESSPRAPGESAFGESMGIVQDDHPGDNEGMFASADTGEGEPDVDQLEREAVWTPPFNPMRDRLERLARSRAESAARDTLPSYKLPLVDNGLDAAKMVGREVLRRIARKLLVWAERLRID